MIQLFSSSQKKKKTTQVTDHQNHFFPVSRLVVYSSHRECNIISNFNSVCVKDFSPLYHSPMMCGLLSVLAEERRYKFWPRATVTAELQCSHTCLMSSSPVVKKWACQCPAVLGQLQLGALQLDVIVTFFLWQGCR